MNRCCLFFYPTAAIASEHMDFEILEEYGGVYLSSDGEHVHYYHTWDDGYRSLIRCRRCGALFLKQFSEYHNMRGGDDCYYTDFYPVASREEALLFNEKYDGFSLEKAYTGMRITNNYTGTQDQWYWNKQSEE